MNQSKIEKSKNTSQMTDEQKKSLEEMCFLLANKNEPNFINEFLTCLFTPSEIKDIATRWLLVKEIDSGMTQREIAQKYHISLCKITRGSKELKKENSAFRKILNEAKKLEKK